MPREGKETKTIAIVTYPGVALLDLVATKTVLDSLAMGTSGSVVMWMAIQRIRSLYSCSHKTTKLVFGEWRCLSQTTH